MGKGMGSEKLKKKVEKSFPEFVLQFDPWPSCRCILALQASWDPGNGESSPRLDFRQTHPLMEEGNALWNACVKKTCTQSYSSAQRVRPSVSLLST